MNFKRGMWLFEKTDSDAEMITLILKKNMAAFNHNYIKKRKYAIEYIF